MDKVRCQFPALTREFKGIPVIYFDGPGGSQLPESVCEAMSEYLLEHNANLGKQFPTASETSALVERVRAQMARFLNASAEEVSFGSNMTTLTFSFSRALARTWVAGDQIILSSMDHDANISPWLIAAEERGVDVVMVPYDDQLGSIHPLDIEAHLTERTRLVAVTASSNVIGSHVDVRKVADAAHKFGALLYVDAVHHAPHARINVKSWDADFVVCSAYKFFGPHLGVFFGKRKHMSQLQPYKIDPSASGTPQCWETGTLNFEAIAGLEATLHYLLSLSGEDEPCFDVSYKWIVQYERALMNHFLEGLRERPQWDLHGRNSIEGRTPTFALTRRGYTADELACRLGDHGVFCWGGHMYAPKLLPYLGVDPDDGVLRVGLMHYNTIEEIDSLFSLLDREFDGA